MFKYPCNFQSFLRFPKVMVIRYRFSSLNLFTLVTCYPKATYGYFHFFFNVNHLRCVESLNFNMCLSKIFMGQKNLGLSLVSVSKELLFFQLLVATRSKFRSSRRRVT